MGSQWGLDKKRYVEHEAGVIREDSVTSGLYPLCPSFYIIIIQEEVGRSRQKEYIYLR